MFPDMMPGATTMLSSPARLRCALYVALIVPDSSAYSGASMGLIGAGSSAAPQASLMASVPYAGAPSSDTCEPKAVYDRLNWCARCLRSAVS